MKNLQHPISIVLITSVLFIAFQLGKANGTKVNKHKEKEMYINRYLDVYGSPSTQNEQCKFELIFYGECEEVISIEE